MAVHEKTSHVSTLSASHATALQDSAVVFSQFFFDAITDLKQGVPFEDTWLTAYLPSRYRTCYDETFGRQFLTCLLTVGVRVWGDEPYRPACVAEQLAFRALLDFAQATLEERGIKPDFGPTWERAFDDLGASALFDESHAVAPRLESGEWFRPIEDAQMHPSIRFQDRVPTRIS
ncbi:MAG TPA: hypothetical protein VKZ50_07175 [bacterium]|nr:hypothetical protein [bacterium]